MINWLGRYWVIGAGFMAGAFLCLAPFLSSICPLPMLLIFLHTPVYMVHQLEEHQGDRFRRFANDYMFGGVEALRTIDILVVNLPVVWGLTLGALYVANGVGASWALAAPYTLLVNALTHLGAALKLRRYNPGLVTAIVLFVPLSIATLIIVPGATPWQHVLGLGIALLIHLLIVLRAMANARTFRAASRKPLRSEGISS